MKYQKPYWQTWHWHGGWGKTPQVECRASALIKSLGNKKNSVDLIIYFGWLIYQSTRDRTTPTTHLTTHTSIKQTTNCNHKRHLVSACFALGSCAGCSNMPVRSLTRTRRRRRATGRVTKRGIRQERRPSLARRVGIAHSPAATARRREDRAPFASLSDWFEKQHRKARGCSQQTTS